MVSKRLDASKYENSKIDKWNETSAVFVCKRLLLIEFVEIWRHRGQIIEYGFGMRENTPTTPRRHTDWGYFDRSNTSLLSWHEASSSVHCYLAYCRLLPWCDNLLKWKAGVRQSEGLGSRKKRGRCLSDLVWTMLWEVGMTYAPEAFQKPSRLSHIFRLRPKVHNETCITRLLVLRLVQNLLMWRKIGRWLQSNIRVNDGAGF